MSIEAEIQALLAEAEPMRGLPDDDPQTAVLAGIIDGINRLRAIQAEQARQAPPEAPPAASVLAPVATAPAEPTKRGPGRPKKGDQ